VKPLVEPVERLTPEETRRYARHLTLPGVGGEGQRRLRGASVLVVGAGGLGSPILLYLAAAGVGRIGIIDDDVVEESNLQRQVLHRAADLGRPKVESARDALLRLDPGLRVDTYPERLDPGNALDLFAAYDLVLDGADNFATRYLSNDAAELTGTPLVWGTIFRFEGQISVFWPGQGPMLRDLFPDIPPADSVPSCADGGVLGVLCGTIGAAMATEAIKVICGVGEPLVGRIQVYDALAADWRTLTLRADPDRPPVTSLAEVAEVCGPATGGVAEVGPGELAAELAGPAAPVLLDVREDWERDLAHLPGDTWLPLGELRAGGWRAVAARVGAARDIVVYCKAGSRSATAVRLLATAAPDGVRLRSLAGGILAWPGVGAY